MLLCTTARKHDLFSVPEIIIVTVGMGIREEKGTSPLNEVSQIAYDTPYPNPDRPLPSCPALRIILKVGAHCARSWHLL